MLILTLRLVGPRVLTYNVALNVVYTKLVAAYAYVVVSTKSR
jgi:hypothetical protein